MPDRLVGMSRQMSDQWRNGTSDKHEDAALD
jgi:hypothetical protein